MAEMKLENIEVLWWEQGYGIKFKKKSCSYSTMQLYHSVATIYIENAATEKYSAKSVNVNLEYLLSFFT